MSGVDCEYAVFVTVIGPDILQQTVCFYTRERGLAQTLVTTLRNKAFLSGVTKEGMGMELPIRHVDFAKL